MNRYCIVCEEGQDKALCEYLQGKNFCVFLPMAERHFRIRQQDVLALRPLVKNAVFLSGDIGVKELAELLQEQQVTSIHGMELIEESDYQKLMKLMDEEHVIRMSKGISENRRPVVTEGPLMGFEQHIQKTNRHKQFAELDIILDGRRILAGLEITEKR